ncbi:substrate-binding and VWA domain-containing protein [Actinokineospora sp. UTMC 2448]|uniref:vWA domain-containing protein n=1 Tax=Actinokineospora sp. UTMC 2448 TaxID=2268449 RepID=UPI002164C30D|nr:substrate-binding and VWA domain-containing protein [Actinokineospora sp. UTMC 2448]UVS79139.1 von Willebrand factor type A domain protein [Actinokineospora sp. UTMC 2448]
MAQSDQRGRWPLIIAVVVGLAASGGLYAYLDAADRPPADCVPLEISSSSEKDKLLAQMAADYNAADREFGGKCAKVTVHGLTSGAAMEALIGGWASAKTGTPEPQVWMPSTSLWLSRMGARNSTGLVVRLDNPSVAASPLVIAMPEEMAEQVRTRTPDPGWADILRLATAPDGWAAAGRPEWGDFTLARDNPLLSSSGLGASVATFHAGAVAARTPLTDDAVHNAEVLKFVRGVESSVTRYGNDAARFVEELADDDRRGTPPISAIVMQEELAYLYNRGATSGEPGALDRGTPPNRPFSVIHPREGTLVFDHPFVVLASASPEQREAAEDFRRFLAEDEQRARFRQSGFRDADAPDRATAELQDTLGLSADAGLAVIAPPPPKVVEAMVDAWAATRRHARVLLVLDVSGSMAEVADPNSVDADLAGRSKISLLPTAVTRALELLSPHDEVGLWTFSTGRQQKVPIGALKSNRDALLTTVEDLPTKGETDLYDTVVAAHDAMVGSLDGDRINAVVVLSDGANTPADERGRKAMLDKIDVDNSEVALPVFTISFGADADRETMAAIAKTTNALHYSAVDDPGTIDEVFASVFSHF